jgi:hypothetical protein
MDTHLKPLDTIIDGTTDASTIANAVTSYMEGLSHLAFPPDLNDALNTPLDVAPLKNIFANHANAAAKTTKEIIMEINKRGKLFDSSRFRTLLKKDESLWRRNTYESPVVGALACVDKGVPAEAILGLNVSSLGRVLGGDIEFSYIRSKNKFSPTSSALIKRLIHSGRQGHATVIELLIEHTNCGRRAQILANEGIRSRIPTLGYIFTHIDALATDIVGDTDKLPQITAFWRGLPRRGASVIMSDAGLYAGIVQKIAQRQALRQLSEYITIISPIEVYEKDSGNLYAGLDSADILTDAEVLHAKGFTKAVLRSLADQHKIFSLENHCGKLFSLLETSIGKKGSYTYAQFQRHWSQGMEDMHRVVTMLWKAFDDADPSVSRCVHAYFSAWRHDRPLDTSSVTDRRIVHHLFYATAYAYLLDTFAHGHEPGLHHIEQYLATGDHEIGTKPLIALGQGDLDRPDATEMYTGYSVLLHSAPGQTGSPIPVIIKLDTERSGHQAMSTEETNVALDDLKEFFRLWPYFLMGDMIPILMVRGKTKGGVSRLGLSVLQSFGDIATLYQQTPQILPHFVPAANSRNEVVLVPAVDILDQGLGAKGKLKAFRTRMTQLADRYSDASIQRAFATTNI